MSLCKGQTPYSGACNMEILLLTFYRLNDYVNIEKEKLSMK